MLTPVPAPKTKVLLVDDSELVRSLVTHVLTGAGFCVVTESSPTALAAALGREAPDLVLVDATFPDATEAEVVALVSPHTSAYRVAVFSDRPEAETAALAARMGALGTVPKGNVLGLAAHLAPLLG